MLAAHAAQYLVIVIEFYQVAASRGRVARARHA
jgi:hypothetical protein